MINSWRRQLTLKSCSESASPIFKDYSMNLRTFQVLSRTMNFYNWIKSLLRTPQWHAIEGIVEITEKNASTHRQLWNCDRLTMRPMTRCDRRDMFATKQHQNGPITPQANENENQCTQWTLHCKTNNRFDNNTYRQTPTERPPVQKNLDKPATERLNQFDFNDARDDWVTVASGGPHASLLHVALDK